MKPNDIDEGIDMYAEDFALDGMALHNKAISLLNEMLAFVEEKNENERNIAHRRISKVHDEYNRARDAIMQEMLPVTDMIEISDTLDDFRQFEDDPHNIWNVDYGNVGIFRCDEAHVTHIYGVGIWQDNSYPGFDNARDGIVLVPEQEYDNTLCMREHVDAGIYTIHTWADNCAWHTDESNSSITPFTLDDKWDDESMWDAYEKETDVLKQLARALPAFERAYLRYASDVMMDAKKNAEA